MSKKYPELEEYGFSEDIILELEKVVQRSCRKDRKVAVKELNSLLLCNGGYDSEIDTLGIDLWYIVKDIDVINKIPKTVKEFKNLELDFKNASNQILMEFMIRVGNYTQTRFSSSFVPRGTFRNIINEYSSEVTTCNHDDIVNPLVREHFLIGFKNWLDIQTYPKWLISKVIENIELKANPSDTEPSKKVKELEAATGPLS